MAEQRSSQGGAEGAEDSAFLNDQLEAETRIFSRSHFLSATHRGHGLPRELRRSQAFSAWLRFWLGDRPLHICANL